MIVVGSIAFTIIVSAIISLSQSCYLHGTDSGVCVTDSLDSDWKSVNMPFCGKVVKYPVCIPKSQSIPPSIEFPNGRWMNHTVLAKDNWISENVNSFIRFREGLEKNKTLRNSGRNELGNEVMSREGFISDLTVVVHIEISYVG